MNSPGSRTCTAHNDRSMPNSYVTNILTISSQA